MGYVPPDPYATTEELERELRYLTVARLVLLVVAFLAVVGLLLASAACCTCPTLGPPPRPTECRPRRAPDKRQTPVPVVVEPRSRAERPC